MRKLTYLLLSVFLAIASIYGCNDEGNTGQSEGIQLEGESTSLAQRNNPTDPNLTIASNEIPGGLNQLVRGERENVGPEYTPPVSIPAVKQCPLDSAGRTCYVTQMDDGSTPPIAHPCQYPEVGECNRDGQPLCMFRWKLDGERCNNNLGVCVDHHCSCDIGKVNCDSPPINLGTYEIPAPVGFTSSTQCPLNNAGRTCYVKSVDGYIVKDDMGKDPPVAHSCQYPVVGECDRDGQPRCNFRWKLDGEPCNDKPAGAYECANHECVIIFR